MNRLLPLGAAPVLLITVVGVSGCGGSDDPAPAQSATTVIRTVTEQPPEPTTTAPTSEAPPPASPRPSPPPPTTVVDAASVVRAYVAAINAQDYQRAWDLGGKNLSSSYAAFVDGFATTAYDSLHILRTTGDTVLVRLEAVQTDGTLRIFEGTYTVRGGTIVGANVHEVPGPSASSPYYENCDEAEAAGAAPLRPSDPGYGPHLDRDGDGVACEPYVP
ncbi:excalibur calcium-binding domain-containing protein [Streptomyces sp. G1]|uniref:excalibur calcium-binding domain-containing protein n=1 Tax=Streptomyces sp. G1 TaxID=361572 RepID=UPI00202F41EE|nr:excalibur calcium-binding domain-containing protein [Streptomyces sp. G1]MCM1973546.1 excalibur calcium-binding domain-containing protein [Streptomyces sp. G1]